MSGDDLEGPRGHSEALGFDSELREGRCRAVCAGVFTEWTEGMSVEAGDLSGGR